MERQDRSRITHAYLAVHLDAFRARKVAPDANGQGVHQASRILGGSQAGKGAFDALDLAKSVLELASMSKRVLHPLVSLTMPRTKR